MNPEAMSLPACDQEADFSVVSGADGALIVRGEPAEDRRDEDTTIHVKLVAAPMT